MKSEEQTRSAMQLLKDQRERVSEAYAMAKKRQTVFGQNEGESIPISAMNK